MLHAATCLATLQKLEDSSTFLAMQQNVALQVVNAIAFSIRNATFVALQSCRKNCLMLHGLNSLSVVAASLAAVVVGGELIGLVVSALEFSCFHPGTYCEWVN